MKLNAGAQLQTFPYSRPFKGVKIILYSNALMAKLLAQTLPFKGMMDRKKRKIKSFFPMSVGKVPVPPNSAW